MKKPGRGPVFHCHLNEMDQPRSARAARLERRVVFDVPLVLVEESFVVAVEPVP
jgi:hypothetical protein